MTTIDFEPYQSDELAEIMAKLCSPNIIFEDDALEAVASTIRNNARSAVKRAKEINLYCGAKGRTIFDMACFDDLCDQIGILPLGISFTEKQKSFKLSKSAVLVR